MKNDTVGKPIRFSIDFTSAQLSDGKDIHFTKSEARALGYLSGIPGRIVTRNQLLDAVSEPGSEKSDRSVDFLINRIRKKLGDDAKNPKFIGSRYGEGYIWLGEVGNFGIDTPQVFLTIGPVRSPPSAPEVVGPSMGFAKDLFDSISANIPPEQAAVFDPAFDRTQSTANARPEYTIELTSVVDRSEAAMIVTTRTFDRSRLIHAQRFPLKVYQDLSTAEFSLPRDYAPLVLAEIWKDRATQHNDTPLQVAMHYESHSPQDNNISWKEADKRLRTLREQRPDDPELKLMYAVNLHAKYVMLGPELFYKDEATCVEDELEIELLVLEALPLVDRSPYLRALSGKMLHFLQKGYENLAVDLTEGALADSVNVASTMAAVGQLRGFRGEFSGALECLEQARVLAERGTEFHVFVLVLLIQVHLARDDRDAMMDVRKELYSVKPATMLFFEVLLTNPDKPSLRAKATTMLLSKKRAQAVLKHLYYISGRLFSEQEHRENMMRCPVTLLRRRFGRDVMSEEMRRQMPNLC